MYICVYSHTSYVIGLSGQSFHQRDGMSPASCYVDFRKSAEESLYNLDLCPFGLPEKLTVAHVRRLVGVNTPNQQVLRPWAYTLFVSGSLMRFPMAPNIKLPTPNRLPDGP